MKSLCLATLLLLAPSVFAQGRETRWLVIPPQGQGAAILNADDTWSPLGGHLYDHAERPVLELQRKPAQELSLIFFPNHSGNLTPEACREEILPVLLKNPNLHIDKKTLVRGQMTAASGKPLATASYMLVDIVPAEAQAATGIDIKQYNTFAFAADKGICAELHASAMVSKRSKEALTAPSFDDLLKQLAADAEYQPTAKDYARFASVFYRASQDWASAAAYYRAALLQMPESAPIATPTIYRYLTDQLALSYGMSGDVARSRAVNEAAIARDPEYPMYYYNLACADAEEHKAAPAREHLQQAFDRRANTLPGETLPDPTQDASILKLKKDKTFWAFVESLPKK